MKKHLVIVGLSVGSLLLVATVAAETNRQYIARMEAERVAATDERKGTADKINHLTADNTKLTADVARLKAACAAGDKAYAVTNLVQKKTAGLSDPQC